MKKQERESLKQKTREELEKLVAEKQKEAAKAQSDMFRGKIKNLRSVKTLKDDIARIKTWINDRKER